MSQMEITEEKSFENSDESNDSNAGPKEIEYFEKTDQTKKKIFQPLDDMIN